MHKKMIDWEKKMLNNADIVTCASEALKKRVIKDLNVTREDIKVIHNPANTIDFKCTNLKKDKKKNILFCGTIETRKGVIQLAKAIPTIIENLGNVRFTFIGNDTMNNDLNISTIDYIKELIQIGRAHV